MPVEIALNTPLADALTSAIQPKLVEVGWGTGGADDSALAEYIILMLVNGKTQEEIAAELAGDLLSLGPDDPNALDFAKWLFEQIAILNGQGAQSGDADAMSSTSPGDDQDMDMAMASEGAAQVSAPTGPKAMRNGNMNIRGNANRDRRMMGQINRAMDRTPENVLHRTRGNDRINSHARGPPSGPRGTMAGGMRQQRGGMNPRAASIAHGMATAMGGGMPQGGPGMNGGMAGMNNGWMPPQGQDLQMGLFQMLEQQNQMMAHLQQQLNQQNMMQSRGGYNQRGGRGGKPLSERVQHQNRQNNNNNFRQGQTDQNGGEQKASENSQNGSVGGEDTEMGQAKRDPKETVCKFNRNCSNKDCKFAHQSPAAPPGITVDVTDVCTYGAACKNHKCVGSHPSPATRTAHNQQQDCKFYPNCTNPHCTFRHPNMPPCRNGGDCSVEGCKFTHVKTMCKFRPCTNRYCAFKHEEGQRGTFQDKVWVAGGEHVSERKFVDESGPVEDILQGSGGDSEMGATEAEAVAS
ncbi:hypothetical protein MGG_09923 [Pyricularia oryzae 70-15]|uniref:Nab2-like CCCH zinc finger domain-containing protein n=3 Tax=Pyricularia oryzae TaxID=318829 RepID=G4MR79_PYRO7|nr:uncharacterized protein MGG_09923 [Pyricularia oryzae 70-15]EHA57411.1 hypothetical protein MGG_09923 [Pyricularia oryzae 70-15]ELQ43551.1 hypothetical protein OOU_Y34scaffold00145g10 [Pyricularia oryzae Y34]KAI7928609.1 hypothetical protein M9X92_001697 [Pyricularia oryzae]KAI7928707.1 hypothetical protein M0657_002531 [Pyricularia oryzae]